MEQNLAEIIHLESDTTGNYQVSILNTQKEAKEQVNKIIYLNKKLKIELSESIKSMNQDQFEKFLNEKIIDNTGVKKLDLSELVKNKKLHYYLYNIVGNNFPLVGISRLIDGQKVLDLTFLGIKDLNETIGKESVDLFLGKLKEIINHNFKQIIDNERAGRLVRDNYKHLTFSLRSDLDIGKKIFNNKKSKKELIEEVLNNISDSEIKKEEKQIILNNFDFGIGNSFIEGKKIKEKLKSFYMGEIASRNTVELNELGENLNFDFNKIKELSKEIVQIEENVISDFSKEYFIYEDINYDVVINGKINPLLLRFIRKGEKISIRDTLLYENIKEYINKLTDGFDFISPVIYEKDYENIDEINKQVGNGIIDINYIKRNYKKTLSNEGLKAYSRNKTGIRLFIDIVDMGIMNLMDFKKLANKVYFGEINENNFDELLTAGGSVTNKFQKLVKEIKKIYPESKISLGGDEIFIFIPGKIDSERNAIISDISKKISRCGLKGRISSNTEKQDEKIFDNLDEFTSINKLFEKKFIETLQKKSKLNTSGKVEPQVTNLEIKNERLIKGNLDSIKKLIKEKINNLDFTQLLFKGESINIDLNMENESGNKKNNILNLEIINKNNLITIKIK